MVRKLQHGGTPGELAKTQRTRFYSQNLCFRRSEVGSENSHFSKFPHDAGNAGLETTFVNHWQRQGRWLESTSGVLTIAPPVFPDKCIFLAKLNLG